MAKQRNLQLYRGTAAQNNLTTGLVGEVTYDTTNKKLRVHDGATEGGFPIAKDAEVVHITGTESIAGGKTFTDNIYAPTAAPGTNTTQVATTAFVQAASGAGLTLGETSTTAYRGDRGKTAYDHSQTTGNPHGTTKTDLGLGNVDNTSDADKPVSTATQTALDGKVDTALVKEPTGFVEPENVIVTYNSTTRKITLTGTTTAYYHGTLVSSLVSGWESAAHDDTVGTYFLYFDGTNFVWGTSFPDFSVLQISVINYRATNSFGNRECHGFMPWQCHKNDHNTIGTYRTAGGDITNLILLSTTADNRRPIVSACTINDEDLQTINAALTSKLYSQRYLSSASDINYNLDAADIVPLSTNNPYYNSFSSPNYGQTLMPANSLMTVWLYEVPVTADAASQKIRHVFVQGQSITQAANSSAGALTTAYNTELAKSPLDLNLGVPAVVAAEYVAIHKFIIQYTGGNWTIRGSIKLTGTRASQVGTPSGNYLTSVSTDATLTGDGTASAPLSVVQTDLVHKTGDETIAGIKTFTNDQNVGNTTTGANQYVNATLDSVEKFTSFVVSGNWTLTAGWSSTNDTGTQLNHNAAGTTTALFLQNAPVIGKTYKVSITTNASVTGGFTVGYGAQITANINPVVSTPTTYDLYFTATAVTNLTITPVTTARFVITAISIKEVGADVTGNLTVDKDIKLGGKLVHKNGTVGLQIAPNGAAIFSSTLSSSSITLGGAVAGATTGGFSGAVTTTQTTTTTPVTGYVLTTAAALVGTPVRISPSVYWNSTAWNTTPTAASKANAIQAYVLPVSGATTSGSLIFANATVDGVANTNELMRITGTGTMNIGGILGYTPAGGILTAKSSNAGYNQLITQNTNNGTGASNDIIVNNDISTDTTTFGDFGINSSTFTGTGSLNLANATYLYSNGGDLVLGTSTANTIRFVYNSGTTDSMSIGSTGVLVPTPTIAGQAANKGYVDTAVGSAATGIFLGTSSTASATAAKEVAITGFTLVTGRIVKVTFTNKNTADVPTLNIESTGAKAIYSEGGVAVSATSPAYFPAGATVEFYYDGTNWIYINKIIKSNRDTSSMYNIYTNGLVTQKGRIFKGSNLTPGSIWSIPVTLSIEMKDVNKFYTNITAQATNAGGVGNITIEERFESRTTTGIQLYLINTNSGTTITTPSIEWEVEGYAA